MKWLKRGLLGLAALILLVLGIIYGGSEYVIRKNYQAQPRELGLTTAPDAVSEGERLAVLYGCYRGCHGRHMEGVVAFDEKPFVRAFAPNLKDALRKYTDQEFEAVVRQGVLPDGRSTWMMPSASFATMTDEQFTAILSFIKNYPAHAGEAGLPGSKFYLMGRFAVLSGMIQAQAAMASGQQPAGQASLDDPTMRGQYLAANACSECHGLELEGQEGFTPPLSIAKAYSKEQFHRLMAEGVGLGDRDLGLMTEVAKMRFSRLRSDEVDVLYDYLLNR